MSDLASLRQTAQTLIQTYGRAVTLRRLSTSPETPAKPWNGAVEATYTDSEVTMLFQAAHTKHFNATEVQIGDYTALVASDDLGTLPKLGDRVIDGGVERAILDLRETKPGANAVIVELLIR